MFKMKEVIQKFYKNANFSIIIKIEQTDNELKIILLAF